MRPHGRTRAACEPSWWRPMGLSLLPFLCELCFKCLAWRHQTRKSLRCCLRIAYALLTRARVLLTQVIVPYADLTRTIFSTSPQFRLTRSNFYMQESKQWLAKSSSGRWRCGRRGRRWWRSTTSRSLPSTKLTTFFDSTLAESTGMTGEFLFGRHGQLLAKAPLAYAQLTRRLRGPYADVRKQLRKTPTEDNQCSFKKRHSNA